MLRRYCESVLYFNTKSRQLERVTEQVVFSLAAALAMALAMLIAFWSQQKYGNSSTSFLVAVVLGYIGKDRLKELGRNYTYLRMHKLMLDHVTNFSSKLSDREYKVGFVKEVVQFVEPNQLDDELEKYRDSRHKYNNGSYETVSMYRRRFYTEDKELPEGVERYADFSVFNLRKKLRNASWQDYPFYYQNGVMVVNHLVQLSYPIELVAGITRDGSVSYQRLHSNRNSKRNSPSSRKHMGAK